MENFSMEHFSPQLSVGGGDFRGIFTTQGGLPHDVKEVQKLNENKSLFKSKYAKECFSARIISKKISGGNSQRERNCPRIISQRKNFTW